MQHHYKGHWKGWALKIETFLGSCECHLDPKKQKFSGPTPSNAPSNDVAHLKTIKYKHHKNNRFIGNFMYTSVVVWCCSVVVCCCVLLCVRGVGRSSCSCVSILAAVLCVLCGGIEGLGGGWQASPSPSHYTVGTHGWMLLGGGGAIVT